MTQPPPAQDEPEEPAPADSPPEESEAAEPAPETTPPGSLLDRLPFDRTYLPFVAGGAGILLLACMCLISVAGLSLFRGRSSDDGQYLSRGGEESSSRFPPDSEAVADVPDDHIPIGSFTPSQSSNPPSYGPHYERFMPAGFYIYEVDPGYLVSSLERGYAVIWYNCEKLPEDEDCEVLMEQIQTFVSEEGDDDLIGVLSGRIPSPVAVSTWRYILTLDEFDQDEIEYFIEVTQGRAAPGGHD